MKKNFFICICIFCIYSIGYSQFEKVSLPFNVQTTQNRLMGNGINDIKVIKNCIWVATGKGLSKSTDNGLTWTNFYGVPEFTKPGIASFDIKGDTIACALIYDYQNESTGSVQTGAGLAISTNGGNSWIHIDQPKDSSNADSVIYYGTNRVLALPILVDQQNVTWGTSITEKGIWVNSWSSTLRKSTDLGKTFKRVLLPADSRTILSPASVLTPSDSLNPLKNRNHLGFSVLAVDTNEIWAGTAGGINRSLDGGISWVKFNHKSQTSPIIGNWVYRIKYQKSKNRIWITTWTADDQTEQNGACYSDNRGVNWTPVLNGKRINGFAFRDSIAYFATDNGIIRSEDNCKTFQLFDNIYDPVSKYKVTYTSMNAVDFKNDTVWVGTSDGLAYTIDNKDQKFGTTWKILRAYQSVEKNKTYIYPNPFSPDDEYARIHYRINSSGSKVTIEIFDFGMNLIRRLISGVSRSGNQDQEEIWDGKDKNGSRIPNGTYFYKVKVDDEVMWGKAIILQ
jgi:hypothetical protein